MARRARAAKNVRVSVSWEHALEQFLLWKQAQGRSPRTIQDYRYHVRWFFEQEPEAVFAEEDALRACMISYMAVPCKPAYHNLKLVSLRGFFDWCREEGYISHDPTEGLKRRKAEGRTVHLESKLLRRLLALPDQKTFVGVRDYALLLLQLDTGIRPKEALTLLPEDVCCRSAEVRIRADNAKTRQGRTLYISPLTVKAIAKLKHCRLDEWDDTVPLFCSYEGRTLVSNHWYKRLSAYGKRLDARISPYDLRHTFALEYLRNGGNSFALQRSMGHADIGMTRRYVALSRDDLRSQHATSSPVANLLRGAQRVLRVKS